MSHARDFYQGLRATLENIIDTVRPWRAEVTSNLGGGQFLVTPSGSDVEMQESMAQIKGFSMAWGNADAVVMPFGGSHIILGKIDDLSRSTETLEFPILLLDDFIIQTPPLGDNTVFAVDATALSVQFPNGTDLKGWSDSYATEKWSIDGATGALVASSFNSPFIVNGAQSTSDAASTTSTVNYSTAMTLSVPLPTGTWTVTATGGLQLIHSAGGNVNFQINVDGQAGTERTLSANASVHQSFVTNNEQTGRTGTINVTVRFKSNAAGTTTARNPWLYVVARRTA